MRTRVAAIDGGTNSLRLLIADLDPTKRELTDVVRRMEIVRLGQGVDRTGMLAPEALDRTFRVLREYSAEVSAAGATATRMVATSATRDAGNADEFSRGVRNILGISPEVITGAEEARLSFAGATAELSGPDAVGGDVGQRLQPPYLVVDIGGGSTEFVVGGGDAVVGGGDGVVGGGDGVVGGGDGVVGGDDLSAISVDIGCVRLTERHFHSDPPTPAEVAAAVSDIDAGLEMVEKAIPVSNARTLVGLAGSVTTITAIALGLPVYDPARTHHARISVEAVHEVTHRLLSLGHDQRAAIGSLHPGRVDVIAAGALVLDRVMSRFGFAEYVASEHDILDGIAWSVVAQDRADDR
jgi:exopolyphosphatase / guanosine-5'-triphosphate,3'-diphosphate pyrophosphatase